MKIPEFKSEIQLQAFCFQYAWNEAGLRNRIFSINNNAKGSVVGAIQNVASGLMKGVPDVCILLLCGKVIWVEFKMPGAKLSPAQIKCHEKWREIGHSIYVCHTFEEFLNIIKICT